MFVSVKNATTFLISDFWIFEYKKGHLTQYIYVLT